MIHSKILMVRHDKAHANTYTICLSLLIKLVMYGTPSVHTEVCNALFAGLTKYSV